MDPTIFPAGKQGRYAALKLPVALMCLLFFPTLCHCARPCANSKFEVAKVGLVASRKTQRKNGGYTRVRNKEGTPWTPFVAFLFRPCLSAQFILFGVAQTPDARRSCVVAPWRAYYPGALQAVSTVQRFSAPSSSFRAPVS